MANNDEYTDKYNDEYLCRDFFVGFNFWSRLSFQISEFRVHWAAMTWPATWRPLAHARCAWWRQRQKDQRSELSVLYLFCDPNNLFQ